MPKGRNPFKEFIEQLPELDNFKDSDEKYLDDALANWLAAYYPKGFVLNNDRRNLMMEVLKKFAKMNNLIIDSQLRPYINAVIDMKWRQLCIQEINKSKKFRKKINERAVIMKFAEDAFILGYCLRSLEKRAKKKKPGKNQQNAKDA